ncbi:MAG: hypothetical protein PVG07_14240 [Acidobacteriota bacterium]|jgi:hypothetical protein
MNAQDLQHLRLLSIFHYVVAGLAALFALLPVFHLVIGVMIATQAAADTPDERLGAMIGWLFAVFAACMILAGLAYALMLALAGRFLAQQRRYTFCMVMAAVSCIFVPIGTVLGVFTLLVLLRPAVQAEFEGAPEPEAAPG